MDRRTFQLTGIYGLWALMGAAMATPALIYLLFPPKARKKTEFVEAADLKELTLNAPEEILFHRDRADGWKVTSEKTSAWVVKTGANEAIKRATGCRVAGAAADRHRIPEIDLAFADGDTFRLGGAEPKVISTPGHTSGHICLWFEREQALLSGDTLFLMGCGKLTEGDAPTMWASLSRLAALPADTQIYCAHEYTLANARFARTVDPDNHALVARIAASEARLERGEATVR